MKESYHKFCHTLPAAVDSNSNVTVGENRPKMAYRSSEEEGERVFRCALSAPWDLNIQDDYKTNVNIQMLAFPSCR